MTACWVLLPALLLGQPQEKSPPLTEAQRAKIQDLVRDTQERAKDLKAKLDGRQHELAKLYGEFKLDDAAVAKLQDDILGLQKQLLANYHKMQVELRAIVGPERFATLRQRIDNILGLTPPGKQKQ